MARSRCSRTPSCGGRGRADRRLTEDGYLSGAPQLVVEVAASSVSYDLHNKKEAYRRNGVREYVVWRVQNQAIDWFHLEDGQYVTVQPDADGLVESAQFPGLKLDVRQMLAGNLAAVLAHLSAPVSGDQESGSPS
jgi:Uma2 family endonuclease